MQLNELGEFGLIAEIASQFSVNLPKGVNGIGDDCAVIDMADGTSQLITTDLLVENVHFILNEITAENLGYKSLAVNLSDIAAMGGTPKYAFLSIALPSHIEMDWLNKYFSGFHELAKKYNVSLLGGDTTGSKQGVIINVTLLGTGQNPLIKLRSSAKPGDLICLTGTIGNSAAGLEIVLHHYKRTNYTDSLLSSYYRPRPHLEEGLWLSGQPCVHAMIDVSDGINSDLMRIMEMSKCSAEIAIDRLPLSPELIQFTKDHNISAEDLAATGGEDYCLLLTVDQSHYRNLQTGFERRFNRQLFQIGKITEAGAGLLYQKQGHTLNLRRHGYNHFEQEG